MGTNTPNDTDEFLAIFAPEIPPTWFRKVRERLRLFIDLNGGNVELCTRFKNGKPQWNDWRERELINDDK